MTVWPEPTPGAACGLPGVAALGLGAWHYCTLPTLGPEEFPCLLLSISCYAATRAPGTALCISWCPWGLHGYSGFLRKSRAVVVLRHRAEEKPWPHGRRRAQVRCCPRYQGRGKECSEGAGPREAPGHRKQASHPAARLSSGANPRPLQRRAECSACLVAACVQEPSRAAGPAAARRLSSRSCFFLIELVGN